MSPSLHVTPDEVHIGIPSEQVGSHTGVKIQVALYHDIDFCQCRWVPSSRYGRCQSEHKENRALSLQERQVLTLAA